MHRKALIFRLPWHEQALGHWKAGEPRLHPDVPGGHIAALYPLVPVGTTVRVTYEPIKFGWRDGACWLQYTMILTSGSAIRSRRSWMALSRYETAAGSLEIDFKALFRALKEKTGVPAAIAHPKTP